MGLVREDSVSFEWPLGLFTLAILPLLLVAFWLRSRRRRKHPVVYGSLRVLEPSIEKTTQWHRKIPAALLLAALIPASIAVARPNVERDVSVNQTSVVMAIDVSLSMCSVDVSPNRLSVAQDAAKQFITNQPDELQIGLVTFAETASLVVPPTDDHGRVEQAVENFTTALGTGIGNAALASIDAIADVNPSVAPATTELSPDATASTFVPDVVVLLTDGANSNGIDPLIAAQRAADRGVRIFTIGFGTDQLSEMICSNSQLGALSNAFPPGLNPAQGGLSQSELEELRPFLLLDEPTLQEMSSITGGEFFRAEDAEQLSEAFGNLPAQVILQQQPVEVSSWFAGGAALLILAALGVEYRRVQRSRSRVDTQN